MTQKVVVPFTQLEWQFVKDNVMLDDLDTLEQVLSFLCMWEIRAASQTPVFIQMTKLVVHAIYYDRKYCLNNLDRSNELNATSIYGLSLTRLINYAVNIGQPKVGPLLSIVNVLKPLGIPERVVHLRQNVVHDEMPALDDLRDAIQFFREWLWEMNWRHPMSICACNLTASTSSASTEKEVPDFNKLFSQFWIYSSKKVGDASEKESLTAKAKAIADRIEQYVSENLQEVLNSFTNAIILTEETAKPVKSHLQIDNLKVLNQSWKVSSKLFDVWKPIIEVFERGRFGLLLGHLTSVLCDEFVPPQDRYQIVAWIRCLVDKANSRDSFMTVRDLDAIARNSISSDKFFSSDDFNGILNLFGDNEERKTHYLKIWNLKRPTLLPENSNDENSEQAPKIFTLENLKSAIKKRKVPKRKQTSITEEDWCLKSLETPLGLTNDQTAETLDLKI